MADQIIIKRSPIVLIRKLALIEALAFLFYLMALGHGSYKSDFYNRISPFANLISYNTAKILFLVSAQFAITIYAFLSWHYESYTLRSGVLIHRRGVFFKKEKTMALAKESAFAVSSGPVGKLLHYGTVIIKKDKGASSIILKDVSYPADQLVALTKMANFESVGLEEADAAKLIGRAEHERLEFKSSLRFDEKRREVNRELERAAMKTVAAFLNSKGGSLVVGVGDGGEVLGLINDYGTLNRQSSDGFENHFTQVFNKMIGPNFRHLVSLNFQAVDGRDVCVVEVRPSNRPVYLKVDANEHFYIRTGNVTTPLKFSEAESYSRARFSSRVEV